jgi:phenylalanyl-tRNA synthetase beta chain
MKFTLSWLKDHLDTTATLDEISKKLTATGLEVESITDPGAGLKGFIVGHLIEAKQHPNADRLRLCTVSTGAENLQVVCGAPNARTGLKVVLARPGVTIPATGDVLKKGKIRDVESQGMMCSPRELKLGEDHDGIIELPESTPVGVEVVGVLNIDPVIEINLTPNRVDALGVRGIARDLAAAGLGALKPYDDGPVPGTFESPRKVAMMLPADKGHLCPQFVGRSIRGVKNIESPKWLKDRLTAIGARPVSALVDITQYLTIDLGRPLHAFDDVKLKGNVGPRLAQNGETLAALNGKTYTLDDTMVVIADEAAAQGIAGIMGGEPTSVTDGTTTIYLESALFSPLNIAASGRKLEINSDARYRFERGVDPTSQISGAEAATRLIMKLCGGEASHLVVGGAEPEWKRAIKFDPARVHSLGGIDYAPEGSKHILERLGFTVDAHAYGWSVTPPSWRGDIEGWQDLVEEVLRIHGYDAIPAVPLPRPSMPKVVLTPAQRQIQFTRRSMAARGLAETTTWSFLPRAHAELFKGDLPLVPLANPISADLDVLRPSLVPNLAAAAGRNANRGFADVALFEVGPRFEDFAPGKQVTVACALRAGETTARHWAGTRRPVDAFDAKADALAALDAAGASLAGLQTIMGAEAGVPSWYHPGRAGVLKLGNQVLAAFGELHPRVLTTLDVKGPMVACEVFLERIPPAKKKAGVARTLLKPSPFQPVERDFAFVVEEKVAAETVLRAVRNVDKQLIADVDLFDVYTGKGIGENEKSLALSVTLQPRAATLTDAEIEAVSAKIVAAVEKACGGKLRA